VTNWSITVHAVKKAEKQQWLMWGNRYFLFFLLNKEKASLGDSITF